MLVAPPIFSGLHMGIQNYNRAAMAKRYIFMQEIPTHWSEQSESELIIGVADWTSKTSWPGVF
jgi:hypothetical protein